MTFVPLLFAWYVCFPLLVDVLVGCCLVVTLVTRDLLVIVFVPADREVVLRLVVFVIRAAAAAASALDFVTARFTLRRAVVVTTLRFLLSRDADSFGLFASTLRLVPAVAALGSSWLVRACSLLSSLDRCSLSLGRGPSTPRQLGAPQRQTCTFFAEYGLRHVIRSA